MKCYPDKINQFFSNPNFSDETKNLVLDLFTLFCKEDCESIAKVVFLSLGFYEVENSDEVGDDDLVIDFVKIEGLPPILKKMIIELLMKTMKNNSATDGSFISDFFIEDLKIMIQYDNWLKVNRKNKLDVLNNINI